MSATGSEPAVPPGDGGGRSALGFSRERLAAFLREALPGLHGPMSVEPIAGGQSNPTFFVDFPGRRLVLRKKPPGPLLPSAHAVDREFRVMRALSRTDVPVPKVLLYCADEAILGTPFYIMERLQGRVFHDCALPQVRADDRRAIYLSMAETLACLHAVEPDAVGLGDFGRPGSYFERQIARWSRQWQASRSDALPALDAVVRWLPENQPADDGRSAIAHGDFRLGNLMVHPVEPRVIAVLDWELSTLGHPLADLGFCCLAWHLRPQEYAGVLGLDLAGLGIPGEAEFVAHYRRHAPPVGPLRTFHLVFALFRFAVIFVGIADRAAKGVAIADNAAEIGRLANNFAERALELMESGTVHDLA